MTPFTVKCDTCLAKLQVKKESAIGQILACPKCNSMIQIKRPEPESNAATNSEGFDDVNDLLDAFKAGETTPRRAANAKSRSTSTTPITEIAAEPILPGAEWESNASKERQKLLVLYGGGAIAVLMGLGIVIYLIFSLMGSGNREIVENTGDTKTKDTAKVDPENQTDSNSKDNDDESFEDPLVNSNTDTNNTDTRDPSEENSTKTVTDDSPKTDEPEEKTDEPKTPVPAEKDVNQDIDNVAPKKGTRIDLLDPLLDGPPGLTPEKPETGKGGIGDSAIAALEKLDPLLSSSSDFDKVLESEFSAAEEGSRFSRDAEVVAKPIPLRLDYQIQLKRTYEGIAIEGQSFATVIDFFQKLTTVPVTFPPRLLYGDLDFAKSISLKVRDVTARELLTKILDEVDLKFVEGENSVIVVPKNTKKVEKEYTIKPFVADIDDANRVADLVKRFVSPADYDLTLESPAKAEIDLTTASLKITQTEIGHQRVAEFVDKIGLARESIPAAHSDTKTLDTQHLKSKTILSEKSKVDFLTPVSLNEISAAFAREYGLNLLIDWESLHQQGWNVNTRVRFDAGLETLENTLRALLISTELQLVIHSEKAFEITTAATAASRLLIEFHPIDHICGSSEEAQLFQKSIQNALQFESRLNPLVSLYLDDGKKPFLIVKASQMSQARTERSIKSVAEALAK